MTAAQLFAEVMLRCSEKKKSRSLDEGMIREVNMGRLLANVSLSGLGLSATDVQILNIQLSRQEIMSRSRFILPSRRSQWG